MTVHEDCKLKGVTKEKVWHETEDGHSFYVLIGTRSRWAALCMFWLFSRTPAVFCHLCGKELKKCVPS